MIFHKTFSYEAFGYRITSSYLVFLITITLTPISIFTGISNLKQGLTLKQEQSIFLKNKEHQGQEVTSIDSINTKFTKVILTGHYDQKHEYFLSKNLQHFTKGFEVITPFILENTQRKVLVNRGWIPNKQASITLPIMPDEKITGFILQPGPKTLPQKTVLLSAREKNGFLRHWIDRLTSPDRYYTYAIKSILFSIVLLILFVSLNIRKIKNDSV